MLKTKLVNIQNLSFSNYFTIIITVIYALEVIYIYFVCIVVY